MTLHTVLLISAKSCKSQLLYKIDDLDILKDDMIYVYQLSTDEVEDLINKGQIRNSKYLFLYHRFEW